jgi:hypothetical protein
MTGRAGGWIAVALPVALVAAILLIVSVVGFVVLSLLGATPLRYGYPLTRALLVAPSVPDWVGRGDGDPAIRIPIPDYVTTKSFDMPREHRLQLVSAGHRATTEQLHQILKQLRS